MAQPQRTTKGSPTITAVQKDQSTTGPNWSRTKGLGRGRGRVWGGAECSREKINTIKIMTNKSITESLKKYEDMMKVRERKKAIIISRNKTNQKFLFVYM